MVPASVSLLYREVFKDYILMKFTFKMEIMILGNCFHKHIWAESFFTKAFLKVQTADSHDTPN